jgi:Asp-tRNA(Asn)/Glu-tRNA(Gln) amidotransferase A subunit family amidase
VFPLRESPHEASREERSKPEEKTPSATSFGRKAQGRYSAAHYRALYLSGDVTPLDVVQSILPFIRRDTSPPGEHSTAWFDVKVDLVIKAAEASTLRYKEKRSLGPLDGVPTAVKDEFDMEGHITSLGSVNDYTGKPENGDKIDAWCVRKLQEAGAIILGKLSMHEFGMGKLWLA